MKYIDFHTHILPEIDDGAKSVSESIEMLKVAKLSGAETVILTPHYDAEVSISEFIKKRDEKLYLLQNEMKASGGDFPKIRVGAEVYINTSLSEMPDLKKLCITDTNLLLLELPYTSWNVWHYKEVFNISQNHDVVPVMAHIERYLSGPKDLKKLEPLIDIGAQFQINAESFLSIFGKKIIRELAAEGLICAFASDCHNLLDRSPDISRALKVFAKKFDDSFIEYIYERSSNLLNSR